MRTHPFLSVDISWKTRPIQAWAIAHWLRQSNGQAMTTFGTPRTDNGTTATGSHTNEEAMRALAANNRRLIGAFHD